MARKPVALKKAAIERNPLEWYHLKPITGEASVVHISHLMEYVSAYRPSGEMTTALMEDLRDALLRARKSRSPEIVDQDGEMFFVVNPAGSIDLCLRWKHYELPKEETASK